VGRVVEFVQQGIALFADLANRTGTPETVGHLLRNVPANAHSVGQVPGVEWLWQPPGDEAAQIGHGAKLASPHDLLGSGADAEILDRQQARQVIATCPKRLFAPFHPVDNRQHPRDLQAVLFAPLDGPQ
jgi:hypothetical protein